MEIFGIGFIVGAVAGIAVAYIWNKYVTIKTV